MDFIGNVVKYKEKGLNAVKLAKRGSNETRIAARIFIDLSHGCSAFALLLSKNTRPLGDAVKSCLGG